MKSPYVLSPVTGFDCAVTPVKFDSIYQCFRLSFNEVERSWCREHARLCCCQWSKSVNQDHQPASPSSWERLKLHRSHVGLFWAATESSRGQATGSRDSFLVSAGEPSLVPARLHSSSFYCSLWPQLGDELKNVVCYITRWVCWLLLGVVCMLVLRGGCRRTDGHSFVANDAT